MVYLVTANIDGGKTGKLMALYEEGRRGDGFISRKIFNKGILAGYEIMRLSDKQKLPFILRRGATPPDWDESFRYGRFSFSGRALSFAESIIEDLITRKTEPVYMDEIGPVELGGNGFYNILSRVLASGLELYIAVREGCLFDVIKLFEIREYEIIKLNVTDRGTD